MSDERRKLYMKKGTGTVPKIKHRNNTSQFNQDQNGSIVLANNLGRDTDRPEYFRYYHRSHDRNPHFPAFSAMESNPEQNALRQNGINTSNGTSTPNTSRTNSRRNSVGTIPKCDNISKYPDKKQIEQKLAQIREYLRVTSSLMSNMKNIEEQTEEERSERENIEVMYNDLLDSEAKLVKLLDEIDTVQAGSKDGPLDLSLDGTVPAVNKNDMEQKVELASREMQMLKEQENLLLHLQLNAESQLREARHAQDKLLKGHNPSRNRNPETDSLHNGYNESLDAVSNSGASSKNFNDAINVDMVKEMEERLTLNLDSEKNSIPEQYQSQIDSLQGRILQLREGTDNRNQLIEMLDNRDAQLQAEHSLLQGKLMELQNKKMQVDQLVYQLQNMNEESEDDEMAVSGNQVKRIVNMKEQLAKLKDMLNIVQNTENAIEMQNINESDVEEHVRRVCSKSGNLLQKDARSNRAAHMENNSSLPSNEQRMKEKQVNKKTMNATERERMKIQAELQAKKRELEELMCKHKAATSNLNQDVNSENKSDLGASGIPLFEGAANSWWPVPTNIYNMPQTNERYSSDECPEDEINEYSEVNSSGELNVHSVQPMPPINYSAANYTKRRTEEEPRVEMPDEQFLRAATRTPERSVSITTPLYQSERNATANKNQIQVQLELIKTVCDSMLEDSSNTQRTQVNVRNNLTPSPIYTEPRQYTSPNAHPWNALNVVNPTMENIPMPTVPPFPTGGDAGNYQNWLATNTLQTQAFMLNTLNQCCQMLWLQQREMSSLRSTITMMQERYQNGSSYEVTGNTDPHCLIGNPPPCLYPPPAHTQQSNNQYRLQQQPLAKPMNPPVIGATSMPNLNHAHCSHTNLDHQACANQCNMQNVRMLDGAALNNSNNSVNNHGLIADHHQVSQSLPAQVWNGQALNNQVPPGNRANNYWDNFRSYSRQNLLSTKSNDGLHNASLTAQSNSSERAQQQLFSLGSSSQSVPKLNTDHQEASTSATTSNENTPRRSKASRQRSNSSVVTGAAIPPDVLNVNQNQGNPSQKVSDGPFSLDFNTLDGVGSSYHHPLLSGGSNAEGFNVEQEGGFKDRAAGLRNRNEWHDDSQSDNNSPKSKLFEELRENVYKEVASLISANQGRPHFLIQLFRDLQLISSDPLRRRTLQSIQSVITNSLPTTGNPTGATRQVISRTRAETEELPEEPVCPLTTDYFDMQPFSWSQMPKTPKTEAEIEPGSQENLSEVLTFLNSHNDDIFSDSLVHALRDILVESTFSAIFSNTSTKDGIIQKHFASLLTEALEQYRGKKVQDVRITVLQTVEDLLRGEISLIRLMRETISESEMNSLESSTVPSFDVPLPLALDEAINLQTQNEDLAEADQSRAELDEEDEGAVGGVLNILLECNNAANTNPVVNDEIDMPKLDLVLNSEADVEFAEQGLDQVPTRLTTHSSSSRANTPSKDKKNPRMDGPDHF